MQDSHYLTKKERRLFRKRQKEEQRTNIERKKKFSKYIRWILSAVFVISILVFIAWKFNTPLPGKFIPSLGNEHIESIDASHAPYNSTPPTSGPHIGSIAEWGIHTQPISNELQVHNLEDGGVMVQYWCGGEDDYQKECQDLVTQLEGVVKKYNEGVILAPYPGLPSKIALTAWTRIDTFDEFDAERIERFIKTYQGIDHHIR